MEEKIVTKINKESKMNLRVKRAHRIQELLEKEQDRISRAVIGMVAVPKQECVKDLKITLGEHFAERIVITAAGFENGQTLWLGFGKDRGTDLFEVWSHAEFFYIVEGDEK